MKILFSFSIPIQPTRWSSTSIWSNWIKWWIPESTSNDCWGGGCGGGTKSRFTCIVRAKRTSLATIRGGNFIFSLTLIIEARIDTAAFLSIHNIVTCPTWTAPTRGNIWDSLSLSSEWHSTSQLHELWSIKIGIIIVCTAIRSTLRLPSIIS